MQDMNTSNLVELTASEARQVVGGIMSPIGEVLNLVNPAGTVLN